jgi:hypothetical protein
VTYEPAAFLRIPPFNAVCPSSGGSREKWVRTTSESGKTLTGVDRALHHEIAVQRAKIAKSEGGRRPAILGPVAVRTNTMGAYVTATGVAFGLLALWAALVPILA